MMNRSALIDMNPNKLKYYLFMISLNKCTASCNVLSPRDILLLISDHITIGNYYYLLSLCKTKR